MLVGFDKTFITPEKSVQMGGHTGEKWSRGVLDDLFVRTMVIFSNKESVVLVSVDTLFVSKETAEIVRKRVGAEVKLPISEVFIFATHTHSGPLAAFLFGTEADENYRGFMEERIVSSIKMAVSRLEKATLRFSRTFLRGTSFNARYIMKSGKIETHPMKRSGDIVSPEGSVDEEVLLLSALNQRDVFMGGLYNLANHPQAMRRTDRRISADFPGHVDKYVSNKFPGSIMLFGNGASGNICPVDAMNPYRKEVGVRWSRYLGSIIGKTLAGMIDKETKVKGDQTFDLYSIKVSLNLRDVFSTELDNARKLIRAKSASNATELIFSDYGVEGVESDTMSLERYLRTRHWKLQQAKDLLLLSKFRSKQPKASVNIGVLIFGEASMIFFPFELFTEYGIAIKMKSPFIYNFIITMTNGCYGYIPTQKAFAREGGYETQKMMSSRFVPESGEILEKKVVAKLLEVFRRDKIS